MFETLPLRKRAWGLRANFKMADAIFIALAEELEEPFATKDAPLATEAAKHTGAEIVVLE